MRVFCVTLEVMFLNICCCFDLLLFVVWPAFLVIIFSCVTDFCCRCKLYNPILFYNRNIWPKRRPPLNSHSRPFTPYKETETVQDKSTRNTIRNTAIKITGSNKHMNITSSIETEIRKEASPPQLSSSFFLHSSLKVVPKISYRKSAGPQRREPAPRT